METFGWWMDVEVFAHKPWKLTLQKFFAYSSVPMDGCWPLAMLVAESSFGMSRYNKCCNAALIFVMLPTFWLLFCCLVDLLNITSHYPLD